MDNDENIIPVSDIPITPPTPVSLAKTPEKKFLLIGLILLITILIGGFLYFRVIDNRLTAPVNLTTIPTVTQTSPTPTPIIFSTAGWNTYTNTLYQYSVKYPSTFFVTEQSNDYVRLSLGQNQPDVPSSETYLSIQVIDNPQKLSLQEWEQINVDVANHVPFPKGVTYLENNGTIFQITPVIMDREDTDGSIGKIFDQILSTFIFTKNNQESYSEDTGVANQKRYVSPVLGISFLYLTKFENQSISVRQEGQKIYVYPSDTAYTDGQFVEVFTKNVQDTLKDAVTGKFLANNDPNKCFIEVSTFSHYPSSYSIAEISYPQDTDLDLEVMTKKMNYCSADYAKTNGMRYFLDDATHPEKFVFLSIGQYSINATPDKGWQDTIQFLD